MPLALKFTNEPLLILNLLWSDLVSPQLTNYSDEIPANAKILSSPLLA
jgi:hypothetical protein